MKRTQTTRGRRPCTRWAILPALVYLALATTGHGQVQNPAPPPDPADPLDGLFTPAAPGDDQTPTVCSTCITDAAAVPPTPGGVSPGPGCPVEDSYEQDATIRAGNLGATFLDWAAANGAGLIIDNLDFIDDPLFPSLTTQKILISNCFQATMGRDPNHGSQANPSTGVGRDPTQFSGTSNKNNDLIGAGQAPWTWGNGSGLPQKDDLTNTYLYSTRDLNGHQWLIFGMEFRATSGDKHGDLEWNQAGIQVNGATSGTLVGLGDFGGRTPEDFIISVDYEGGGTQPSASFRVWDGTVLEFMEVEPPANSVYIRTNLDGPVPGGPWGHFNTNGSDRSDVGTRQLFEGAADLTALGVEVDPCQADATAMFKSRSSSSFTAELKDVVLLPFPLAPTPDPEVITADDCPGVEHTDLVFTAVDHANLPNPVFEWDFGTLPDGVITIPDPPVGEEVIVRVPTTPELCDVAITGTVTVTAGDCSGTSDPATARVVDAEPPTISVPGVTSPIECPAEPQFPDATLSDNCGATLDFSDSDQRDACGLLTRTRTWTAVDRCGNEAVPVSRTIQVVDTTRPVLTVPGVNPTVECPAEPEFPAGEATDACQGSVPVTTSDQDSFDACGLLTRTRTYTARDCSGNETSTTRTIQVVDTTRPTIAISQELVDATTEAGCEATLIFQAIITDACGSVPLDQIVCNATGENVDAGVVSCQKDVQPDGSVLVTGTVSASNLRDCPARVRITVDARDCSGNAADQLESGPVEYFCFGPR